MLFENNDYREDDLFSSSDSLKYGNAFKNLYRPYKNYKVEKLVAKNERGSLLLRLQELDFIINDLNLYLILHEDDKHYYDEFKRYIKEYKDLLKLYETKYQVIDLFDDTLGKYTFSSDPWPWEDEYV